MALSSSFLRSAVLPIYLSLPTTATTTTTTSISTLIRCGPRSKRGPLVKGRILSIEAIHAIQSLKRNSQNDAVIAKTLSRLIKSDLVSALHELLRQEQTELAFTVFTTLRKEHHVGLSLHADIILGLCKKSMWDDVDSLIADLAGNGVGDELMEDEKGLVKLVRVLVENGRVESTVRVFEMMKRCGYGQETWKLDDYLLSVLSKGFRRFDKEVLAEEVERLGEGKTVNLEALLSSIE